MFCNSKLKLSKGFAVFLAVKAVLSKVVNTLLVNIVVAEAL